MNENNLKDLRGELKKLGFEDRLVVLMEEQMRSGVREFALHDQVLAAKGHVGIALHFRQSTTSDYFYLNRMEATRHWGRGLEPGQCYQLIVTGKDDKVEVMMGSGSLSEAVSQFKSMVGVRDGIVELAAGKSLEDRVPLATMEEGRYTYVSTEYRRDIDVPPLPQTFWLERGRGFTREQAANLVQGRAVYREDLLSMEGKPYKAWVQLDMERDREGAHQNLPFNHYTDAYGYELKSVLDEYKLKELADPKKLAELEENLKNGNRVLVTVARDGKDTLMLLETSVRYGKVNFYGMNGAPEKREQFQKVPDRTVERALENGRDKSRGKDKPAAGQGMGM